METDTLGNPETTYDGWPLRLMTLDNLLEQGTNGGIYQYVWPYEGTFLESGRWKFHGTDTVMDGDTEVEAASEPLMVDASSARGFKLVWEAINDTNKEKTKGFLESRGLTCWMFDTLIWPNIGFGAKK